MKRTFTVIAAIIVILIAALALLGANSSLSTDIPEGFKGEHRNISGVKLRVWQKGDGQDVLLIHGLPGSIESWDSVADKLAENYRVTIYDRPGHGFSEYQETLSSLQGNVRIANAVIDTLDLKNVIVIGHSYGGSMVTAMAAGHNDNISGYISIAGVVEHDISISPVYHIVAIPTVGAGFARLGNQTIGKEMMKEGLLKAFSPNPLPEGFIARRDDMWLSLKSSLAVAHEEINYPRDLATMKYTALAAPFHMMYGRDDASVPLSNAYAIKENNQHATLEVFEETGHMIQFIHPDAVVDAVAGYSCKLSISNCSK